MALLENQFNQVTLAAGASATWTWTYNGAVDTGPNYICAYWLGANDNYGTVTTVQTSITAFYTDQYGYYWPTGISYAGVLRNDTDWPAWITISIGNFQ